MAARRKRAPEPVEDEPAPAPRAAKASPPPSVILRCTQTHGLQTDIETTMVALTGEGVEVPNYTVRVTLVS